MIRTEGTPRYLSILPAYNQFSNPQIILRLDLSYTVFKFLTNRYKTVLRPAVLKYFVIW